MAGVGLMLSSCLIEDPPPYTEPQQTPPRLDLRRAVPLIDQIIVRARGESVPFNVPVASEDAGDDLLAFLLLNYTGESSGAPILASARVPASTLDDTDRVIALDWSIDSRVSRGCQRLTLQVSHVSNMDFDHLPLVFDKSDLAIAVWWANIDLGAGSSAMLTDCPLATGGGQ